MYAPVFKLAIAIGALAGYATATTYANFCDDGACSVNCGISVSTDNPGCLGESGRNSVSFHDPNFGNVALVTSPDGACSCQNYCYDNVVLGTGAGGAKGCLPLTGPSAGSFRFVGMQSCDENNC